MIGLSIYVDMYARRVRVPGGSKFHLAPGTITPRTSEREGQGKVQRQGKGLDQGQVKVQGKGLG